MFNKLTSQVKLWFVIKYYRCSTNLLFASVIEHGGTPLPPILENVWCSDCALNNGGFSLLFFEHQADDMVHEDFLDLDADEFWSSSPSRRFSQFSAWCHLMYRSESIRSCMPLSSAREIHKGVAWSFAFLSMPWVIYKYRFPWNWWRWIKSWWLWSEVGV
jgi:hypothetical protein